MATGNVASIAPPCAPWTAASSPGYSIHALPLPAFEALADSDLKLAASLAPESIAPLTDFLVSPSNRKRWRRRLDEIAIDGQHAPWMVRLIVVDRKPDEEEQKDQQDCSNCLLSDSAIIVGRIGFHGKPDERGMVEVGYEIDPAYWGKGHATAAMNIIVELSRSMEGVNILRACVGEGNLASRRVVVGRGLQKISSHVHEIYGPGHVYELVVKEPGVDRPVAQ